MLLEEEEEEEEEEKKIKAFFCVKTTTQQQQKREFMINWRETTKVDKTYLTPDQRVLVFDLLERHQEVANLLTTHHHSPRHSHHCLSRLVLSPRRFPPRRFLRLRFLRLR